MATRIKYTKEFREQVLKEIEAGKNIEDVSKCYEVPVFIIKEWQKMKGAETCLEASFFYHKELHTSRWTPMKDYFYSMFTWVKDRGLIGGLLFGCLFVVVLSIAFNSHEEFHPKVEPKVNLAPKVDSLILQGLDIENCLNRQNELSLSISNIVTNIHKAQKPPIVICTSKDYMPIQKKCSCSMNLMCTQECNCKNDSIR